jgi:hypothetical protein
MPLDNSTFDDEIADPLKAIVERVSASGSPSLTQWKQPGAMVRHDITAVFRALRRGDVIRLGFAGHRIARIVSWGVIRDIPAG